jgi:hypothetical protein
LPPSIPQNLSITTGNGQIYIQWQQVVGASSYTIQRSTTGLVGSFTTLDTSVVNSYIDAAVTIGQSYYYQIAGTNVNGTGSYATMGTNDLPLMAVPCLPGQINLGFIRYMAKLKADKLFSQFLTDDEWDFNINQSTTRLYDLLITKFGEKYFLAPPLVFNTNGTAAYPLPDGALYGAAPALYKLAGVDCGINATNNQWFTLPKFNWIDRNRYNTLQLAGTVQSIYGLSYCDFGNMLYFIPLPTSAQTIQLWYIPMLKQMLLDTDMMAFSISGWSELVIVDAAIKALIKEESYDQATALIAERTALIDRIEETAANRDVGQPNTVSNTRARAGDQNFGGPFNGFNGFGGGGGWG